MKILLELRQLVSKCFYCKKSFSPFSKKWPIHPRDRAYAIQDIKDHFGNLYEDKGEALAESIKPLKMRCCDKCWHIKVAEIGLTVATGDKKVDAGKVGGYIKNAIKCFRLGKFREALAEISCAEELSLKSLGTDLGYEAHQLAGECHSEMGNREEAIRERSLALEILKGTPLSVGGANPFGGIVHTESGLEQRRKVGRS